MGKEIVYANNLGISGIFLIKVYRGSLDFSTSLLAWDFFEVEFKNLGIRWFINRFLNFVIIYN